MHFLVSDDSTALECSNFGCSLKQWLSFKIRFFSGTIKNQETNCGHSKKKGKAVQYSNLTTFR